MSYCTPQQLADRYSTRVLIDLSDRGDERPEEPDAALFDRAIADADALIDGHLKLRYALPLTAVPTLVTDLALRIAIYYAHGQVVPEKIRDDFRDAQKTLAAISAGTVVLDVAGVEPAPSGASEVLFNEPSRPMTADTMKGYV